MLKVSVRSVIWFLVILLGVYFLYFNTAIKSITTVFPKVYSPDDSETNYIIALIVSRGGGLYKDFSIVYPPARFLLEGLLFRIFSPTLPLTFLYFTFVKIVFAIVLFFLSKKIFDQFLQIKLSYRSVIKSILAILTVLIYQSFINSAQEVHAVVALFFLAYISFDRKHASQFIVLGVLLALVFLFRIDAGILLTVSLLVAHYLNPSRSHLFSKYFFVGSLLVFIPVFILITFHGSLINFLYDSLYLGLIIQPKMMSLPLPPPPVGKVFWAVMIFILFASCSMALYAQKLRNIKNITVTQAFCLFAALSFASALGRSDEAHLWYGSVWMSVFIVYGVLCSTSLRKILSVRKIFLVVILTLASLVVTYALLYFKNPSLYIVITVVVFIIVIRQNIVTSLSLLLGGTIASLIVFHSAAYLRLIYSPPHPKLYFSFNMQTFTNGRNKLAGMTLSTENKDFLNSVKQVLNPREKYLFIYPDSVLYYEYFHLKNPTRHYYLTGETTEKLQHEIIADLQKNHTKQFLIFPEKVTYKGSVWMWLLKNTSLKKSFIVENLKAEVRIKN